MLHELTYPSCYRHELTLLLAHKLTLLYLYKLICFTRELTLLNTQTYPAFSFTDESARQNHDGRDTQRHQREKHFSQPLASRDVVVRAGGTQRRVSTTRDVIECFHVFRPISKLKTGEDFTAYCDN